MVDALPPPTPLASSQPAILCFKPNFPFSSGSENNPLKPFSVKNKQTNKTNQYGPNRRFSQRQDGGLRFFCDSIEKPVVRLGLGRWRPIKKAKMTAEENHKHIPTRQAANSAFPHTKKGRTSTAQLRKSGRLAVRWAAVVDLFGTTRCQSTEAGDFPWFPYQLDVCGW